MKMENLLVLGVALLGVLSSGCATMTGATNQSISVQAREQSGKDVPGASCELTNSKGRWSVETPGTVTISRSNDEMQVMCRKSGLEVGRVSVESATKGAMFGNIILGGPIGAVIDHNSGAAYEYPNVIQVVMGMFSKILAPSTDSAQGPNPSTVGGATGLTQSQSIAPPQSRAEIDQSVAEKLTELKRLSDSGLISHDVYLERQRLLLDGRR